LKKDGQQKRYEKYQNFWRDQMKSMQEERKQSNLTENKNIQNQKESEQKSTQDQPQPKKTRKRNRKSIFE
jgi:hypothetical protein